MNKYIIRYASRNNKRCKRNTIKVSIQYADNIHDAKMQAKDDAWKNGELFSCWSKGSALEKDFEYWKYQRFLDSVRVSLKNTLSNPLKTTPYFEKN